eukprot:g6382.t1
MKLSLGWWRLLAVASALTSALEEAVVSADGASTAGASTAGSGVLDRHAALREAKQAAREQFLLDHPIVFDSFGRVLRWGVDPVELRCSKQLRCVVTQSRLRRFRTKDEELRQRQIRLDRQAEADGRSGNLTEADVRRQRQAKEDRGRCRLYGEWLRVWLRDDSKTKAAFFQKLGKHHADFGELRGLHRERSLNRRKATALYRHIALQVHPDKLPKRCDHSKRMQEMMRDILSEAERMKNELLA